MNHKKRMKIVASKKKHIHQLIRKTWGDLNPVTKVIESKKKYKRSREKIYYECEG
jgi:hypothetical protein